MPEKTPPWFDATPDQRRYPQLRGNQQADVVVIGGGIAGVLTAWRLAERGAEVALLEQNHIATGDTGYTTAFVTRVPDVDFAALEQRYGIEYVRKLIAANAQAQEWLRTTLREQHVECDWQDCWSFHCAYEAGSQVLAEEWEVVRRADPRASKVAGSDIRAANPAAAEAIRYDGEARYDARAAVVGLLGTPTGKRIQVFEESAATAIELEDASSVTVQTERGAVAAKTVVVATGRPIEPFTDLHELLTSDVTFALTARYSGTAPISDDVFWDTDEPYQYYRRLGRDTIVLGGADRHEDQPAGKPPHEQLEQFLRDKFPSASDGGTCTVTKTWQGSLFYTDDGVPFIGAHPHHPRVLIATGFGGQGMVSGALSALVLGDLALGKPNPHAALLSFERTGKPLPPKTAASPQVAPQPAPVGRSKLLVYALRVLLPLVFAAALVIPALAFFSNRGGTGFLAGLDLPTFSILMFPLVGLYAFTLLWVQFMLGSSLYPLRAVFPWIETFHRTEGVFVLLFALLHPTLVLLGVGSLAEYFKTDFVADALVPWVWVGEVQLTLLCITVATAILRKTKRLRTRWHYIHYANYIVFGLAWLHSWNLGTDVQSSLAWLWYCYGATALISAGARLVREVRTRRRAKAGAVGSTSGGTWHAVAAAADFTEGKPHCATAGKHRIAVCKVEGEFYAIDNTCTHAGGPLCEGSLAGNVVTCPWHGSRFAVDSGKVVGGPAQRAIRTYRCRVRAGTVEVQA